MFAKSQDADILQGYLEAHVDLVTNITFVPWGHGRSTEMNEVEGW